MYQGKLEVQYLAKGSFDVLTAGAGNQLVDDPLYLQSYCRYADRVCIC